MFHSIFLDGTFIDFKSTAACLVSHCNYSDNIKSVADEFIQRCYCKLRGTHIYDSGLLEKSHDFSFYFPESALERIHAEN